MVIERHHDEMDVCFLYVTAIRSAMTSMQSDRRHPRSSLGNAELILSSDEWSVKEKGLIQKTIANNPRKSRARPLRRRGSRPIIITMI